MPGAKKTGSQVMKMDDLVKRVSENSKSWRTARAAQLAKLKKNHFEHYAPGNIEEARADLMEARGGGAR